MIGTFGSGQRSGFSRWLRTGKLPSAAGSGGLELKYNRWHDPADGRFTFANAGSHQDAGGADKANGRASGAGKRNPWSRPAASPKAGVPRAAPLAGDGRTAVRRGPVEVQPMRISGSRPGSRSNSVTEFVGGVGQGLYGVVEGTVTGVRDALTTNPATTVRNAGRAIAGTIDTAIAAETIPARVQVARAASAVANASARDIGRATGSVAGNVAVAAAPGAALAKVSAMRHIRMARPRPTFDPPQIGWVKETLKPGKPWKSYNDAATGSRPGQAPTLMRTMPDGSKRPVKFDGVQGYYVIDRKFKVVDAPRARAQLLRQSEVLAQHRLTGIWEVPTPAQKVKGLKLLQKTNVTNILIRVVKP